MKAFTPPLLPPPGLFFFFFLTLFLLPTLRFDIRRMHNAQTLSCILFASLRDNGSFRVVFCNFAVPISPLGAVKDISSPPLPPLAHLSLLALGHDGPSRENDHILKKTCKLCASPPACTNAFLSLCASMSP